MKAEGPYDYVFNLSALKACKKRERPIHAYAYDYGQRI